MKKIALAFSTLVFTATLTAQVKMPAPSPLQTITQDFALGSIEVKYSRPAAKGRKVFGDLVPMNKLWRTGANSATVIRFTDVVEINGKKNRHRFLCPVHYSRRRNMGHYHQQGLQKFWHCGL